MKARMLIDLNEHIKKGDEPPEGDEKRFIRAGIAEEVKPAKKVPARKKAAPKKKAAKK